jgi:hypothetical protein
MIVERDPAAAGTDDRMTNYRGTKGSFAILLGFVPEGLDDRSQAIYCLGCVTNGARPVGYGVMGNSRLVKDSESGKTSTCTNHTVPTGRVALLRVFHAINCLATIILSLRDNTPWLPDPRKCPPSSAGAAT